MAYGQYFYGEFKNIGLVLRKSDIIANKQQRFTQVWPFAKSNQRLCYSYPGLHGDCQLSNLSLEMIKQTTKVHTSLVICQV